MILTHHNINSFIYEPIHLNNNKNKTAAAAKWKYKNIIIFRQQKLFPARLSESLWAKIRYIKEIYEAEKEEEEEEENSGRGAQRNTINIKAIYY